MSVRILRVLAMSLVLAAGVSMMTARAEDAPKGEKKPHGGPVAFILKHAEELKLTDEQKTKLEALAKDHAEKPKGDKPKGDKPAKGELPEAVKAILTADQLTTLKSIHEKEAAHKKPEPTK